MKTVQSQVVDGLMVQLISEKTSIRTTVYTDEAGRYEFPVLEAGEYVLRVPRPLEFRHYTRKGVRIDGVTRLDDILVERIGDSKLAPGADFPPPVPELLPQLTGAEWLSNLEGTEQEKAAVLKGCSIGCHSVDYAFHMTFDDASWPEFLHRMIVPAIRPFPRPSGPATRAVVTEYELPWATVDIHDVAGDGQGNIWFTINRSPFIGKLDSKTGKVISYRISPVQPPPNAPADAEGMAGGEVARAHPGLQHIWVDKTGIVWFTGTWASSVGRLDPRTGDIQQVMTDLMYPEEDMAATHNLGFSPDGTMYKTGHKKIYKWEPSTIFKTGKPIKMWPMKDANSTYGNFVSWDGRYFGGGGQYVVWLDTQTGEVRERKLTVGGKGRGAFDPFGNIWVGGDRLAEYDPKADTLVEYRLPAPWSLDFNSWIDNSPDPPTFWYGDQLGYVVCIQPLE